MKPAAFGYLAPETVEEAMGHLEHLGPDAKVLAGGQSLVPLLNLRLTHFAYLLDINRISPLHYIRSEEADLALGALCRHRDAETSTLVSLHCPLLARAEAHVGHRAIRERGTVCGSLVHADPSAELSAVLVALRGSVRVAGGAGERPVPAEEFFLGGLVSALEPGELAVEARFPKLPRGTGSAFLEISRRSGDFAIVGVAAAALPDGSFRLGVCGAAQVAYAPAGAELAAAEGDFRGAGQLAAEASDPDDDLHASAAYRRAAVATLVERALAKAAIEREAMSRG